MTAVADSEALAVVQRVYAAAAAGDWESVTPLMSPDLVIHEPASLPYGGEWRGQDALQRLFVAVMAFWRDPHIDVDGFASDGRHVVALVRLAMTSRHTGNRFTQPISEVSVVEDGLITEMRVYYFDSALVAGEAGNPSSESSQADASARVAKV